MCNATLYKTINEWEFTIREHGDFLDFVESEFPEAWKIMQSRDFRGIHREPPARMMQIILKAWQKNHDPIEYRITRVSKKSEYERYSY